MKEILKELSGWLFYIFIAVAVALLFVNFVAQRTIVDGSSMESTLSDGDQLIVDKLTYHISDPKRYDIVVFPYQYGDHEYYIKRVIGLPGETVQIVDGMIYINGQKIQEAYGNEVMESAGIAQEPVTLAQDEYFVLGDNRNNSKDSRAADVGPIHRKDLIGKAWLRILPFSKIGFLRHGDR